MGSYPPKLFYCRLPVMPGIRDLIAAVLALWKSDTMTERLRERLRHRLGITELILTASGREALRIAIEQTPAYSEIVIPAYGCPIVHETVVTAGRIPVHADIEAATCQPSGNTLISCVTPRTSGIICVHEFGLPMSTEALKHVRARFDGLLIEDAALALLSGYSSGQPVGQIGNATVLSGSIGKPVSAISWGALAYPGNWTMTSVPTERQSGAISLVRGLGGLVIQQPQLYRIIGALVSVWARSDAVYAPDRIRRSSKFDDTLMLRALERAGPLDTVRCQIGSRLMARLRDAGIDTLKVEDRHMAISRLPFYTPSHMEPKEAVAIFQRNGIEVSRPYQINFSGASPSRYPNSHQARTRLLAVTIRPDFDHQVEERFLSCVQKLMKRRAT